MEVGMMIVGGPLRILFATIHAAIKDVPALLTPERIAQAIRLCHRGLTELFGIKRPRIAVAALNPHAGEGGLFGTEERTAIGPGIERALAQGFPSVGMTRPGPRASAAPAHVPRRSLGQHFLIDKNIVHKIVRLAELQPGETVLEIGPGRGILTDALLDSSGLVVAVELDAALCAHLRATLRRRSNFRLVEGDALTFDYAQV